MRWNIVAEMKKRKTKWICNGKMSIESNVELDVVGYLTEILQWATKMIIENVMNFK